MGTAMYMMSGMMQPLWCMLQCLFDRTSDARRPR